MKKIFTLVLFISVLSVKGQVNGYGKVSLIVGPALTISVSDETYDTFDAGDKVLVMQMQDDVIGSNTSDNASFGNLSNAQNAGHYEIATILAVVRTGILPTLITLTGPLQGSYNIGANTSVQIVTFPQLGTSNYSTNANISALAWNGNYGGVVAFRVQGILTLRHNITADAAGFRGGAADAATNPYGSCNSTNFISAVHPFYGNKGEGIYKATNANFAAGKGKIVTGGGGGNTINAGGGGGGNFTAGGEGFYGWNCATGTGGIGGITLGSYVSGNRFFLGGGGGSGERNDASVNRGGAGGGIIIITAGQIRTTGSGTTLRISADGEAAPTVTNDGGGGGGAGGSVLLNVPTFNISNNKRLIVSASGGNGSNVNDGSQHGGGGGGGQGAVIYTSIIPNPTTSYITTNTANGIGGQSRTGGPRAANGVGSDGIGVISSTVAVLPLRLIAFNAAQHPAGVLLNWKTQMEENVSHFEIEKSVTGSGFEKLGTVKASGGLQTTQNYSLVDPKIPAVTTYYRLKMVDLDGKYTISNTIVVKAANTTGVSVDVYPNPVTSSATVYVKSDITGTATLRVMNMQGATLMMQNAGVSRGENAISLNKLPSLSAGVYSLQVSVNGNTYVTKMMVR